MRQQSLGFCCKYLLKNLMMSKFVPGKWQAKLKPCGEVPNIFNLNGETSKKPGNFPLDRRIKEFIPATWKVPIHRRPTDFGQRCDRIKRRAGKTISADTDN